MSFKTLAGSSLVGASLLAVLGACGDDASGGAATTAPDGGAEASTPTPIPPSDPGDGGDGGPGGTVKLTPQKISSNTGIMIGVTTDGQVVYLNIGDTSFELKAIPLAGGAAATIDANYDNTTSDVVVSGGAVGWWTNEGADGLGTFNVWTKATGAKTALTTTSVPTLFSASADGSHIAYSTGTTGDDVTFLSTEIVFADTATVATDSPTIFATDRVDLASPTCTPFMEMHATSLVATFCTGEDPLAEDAELYVVPAASKTTPIRLDDIGPPGANGTIYPDFFANDNASILYARSSLASRASRIVHVGTDAASSSATALEDNSANAAAFDDASGKVIYQTLDGLHVASTAGAATPASLADGVAVLRFSKDAKHALVRLKPRVGSNGPSDVAIVDTSKVNQTPLALVPDSVAVFATFAGDGKTVIWAEGSNTASSTVKSIPITGGDPLTLTAAFTKASFSPGSPAIIGAFDPVDKSPFTFVSLRYFDTNTGAASDVISDSVDISTGYLVADKALVYFRIAADSSGLFRVTLPD